VALNWVVTQPGITSTIIGATKIKQLDSNLEAIKFTLPAELRKKLDDASKLEPAHPYMFFEEVLQDRIRGGVKVRRWNG
jgi:aryl-alcohol dehydrogenase-like predicted oxidoreductase